MKKDVRHVRESGHPVSIGSGKINGTPACAGVTLVVKACSLILLLLFFSNTFAHAAVNENDTSDNEKGASGLTLPRFATLRSNDVNMRTGPGTRYPIEWVFSHQGLPVEITAEYEIWRRVRDSEGAEGWVHKSALTGKRGAIITGSLRELRGDADPAAAIVAHLEVGSTGQLISCKIDWCKLKFSGIKGYLRKNEFWGAYPKEVFD